eukprot:850598-Ditylum_brightwellii.AAC.1
MSRREAAYIYPSAIFILQPKHRPPSKISRSDFTYCSLCVAGTPLSLCSASALQARKISLHYSYSAVAVSSVADRLLCLFKKLRFAALVAP